MSNPYRVPAELEDREDDPCPKGEHCCWATDPMAYGDYLCIKYSRWPKCGGPYSRRSEWRGAQVDE